LSYKKIRIHKSIVNSKQLKTTQKFTQQFIRLFLPSPSFTSFTYNTITIAIQTTNMANISIESFIAGFAYRMFGMLCNKFFSGEVSIADPYIDGKLM